MKRKRLLDLSGLNVFVGLAMTMGLLFADVVMSQRTAVLETPEPVRVLVYVGNDAAADVGPTSPVTFRVDRPFFIQQVIVFHRSSADADHTVNIALTHENGTTYGPWQTQPRKLGMHTVPGTRECMPLSVIPPGSYTLVDSDPGSWLHNSLSGGRGFCQVLGIADTISAATFVAPAESDSSIDRGREVVLGSASVRLPDDWKVGERIVEREGEEPLKMPIAYRGNVSAPEVSLAAGVHADFGEAMQWFFDRFDATFAGREETTVAGRAAAVYTFSTMDKTQRGRLILFTPTTVDGTVITVAAWAPEDNWEKRAPELSPWIASAGAAPASVPIPTDVASASTKPAATTEEPARPRLTFSETRIYQQDAGRFRLQIPDGWKVKPGHRNLAVDPEFDSLLSPSDDYVVILERTAQAAENPELAMRRWIVAKWSTDGTAGAVLHQRKIAGMSAICLAYRTSTPRTIYRLTIAGIRYWLIINIVAPGDVPLERLPDLVEELFGKLQILPATTAIESPYAVIPESDRGQAITRLLALNGLTQDFGVQAYERGVLVKDMISGREAFVSVEPGVAFPPLGGSEAFLKKRREGSVDMGAPVSSQAVLFDFRIGVQVFDGGILVHDPNLGRLWATSHAMRNTARR